MSKTQQTVGSSSEVFVRQVRSTSGRTKEVVRTMQALGLRGIGDVRKVVINRASVGMIKRVHQLVVVESVR